MPNISFRLLWHLSFPPLWIWQNPQVLPSSSVCSPCPVYVIPKNILICILQFYVSFTIETLSKQEKHYHPRQTFVFSSYAKKAPCQSKLSCKNDLIWELFNLDNHCVVSEKKIINKKNSLAGVIILVPSFGGWFGNRNLLPVRNLARL